MVGIICIRISDKSSLDVRVNSLKATSEKSLLDLGLSNRQEVLLKNLLLSSPEKISIRRLSLSHLLKNPLN